MNKDKKPIRTSTYEMLKKLDKKVQKETTEKKEYSPNRSRSGERHRKRSQSPRESRNRDYFRQSFKKAPEKSPKEDVDHDQPDRSYGDLYCKACDSHMNSEQMWEAHIQGKRHLKSVKKGELDYKYDVIDEDPIILPELKNAKDTLIGLNYCCEIQRWDGNPFYQCFLCSSNLPNAKYFIEHVVGNRHRMAYLKEHDPVKHDLISKTDLKKGMIEPVVADCIRLHHEKYGQGTMQVKKEREKAKPNPEKAFMGNSFSKRPFIDDFEPKKKRDDRSNFPDRYDDHDWRQSPGRDRLDSRYDRDFGWDRKNDRDFGWDRGNDRDFSWVRGNDRGNMRPDFPGGNWAPVDDPYYRDDPRRRISPPPSSSYSNRRDEPNPGQAWGPPTPQELAALEKKRAQEKSSKTNVFQSVMTVIENMPAVLFLEIVLRRLENIDPTEAEMELLKKIGNHMISIVMNKKLQNLSPDLLNKYQQSVSTRSETPMATTNAADKSNLSNLMTMIDNIKSSTPSNPPVWSSDNEPDPGKDGPAFMTQTNQPFYNLWQAPGSQSPNRYNSSAIPGLTLSSTSEAENNNSPWNNSTSYPSMSSYPRY